MRFVMFVSLLVLPLLALACSKPKPPTLTPKSMMATAITPDALELQLEIGAYNPNDVALAAKSVEGQITVDGKYDLGTVSATSDLEIPPKAEKTIRVPMKAKWPDVAALALLAAQGKGIPYTFTGSVKMAKIDVELPVTLSGVIPPRQLVDAASRGLGPINPNIPRPAIPH